jgi:sulfur carrier protein
VDSFCAFLFLILEGGERMKVNGCAITLTVKNQSLWDFLESRKYDMKRIAVERNGKIVPKTAYKDVTLSQEDTLEIVNFVGGG